MKQIAQALVKAQKGFSPALKTSTNPHFKSRYADLSNCVEAVIDSLNEAGIALIQRTHECESGVTVETVFVHESGEMFEAGKLHVPASKNDPQGYGSALTYARRYSLMAACGIAPEDDDGNAASKPKAEVKAITPKSGSIDRLSEPRMKFVAESFSRIAQLLARDDEHGAFQIYDEITDADERTALRNMLDSKQRAALKAIADQQTKPSLAEQA